MIPKKIVVAEFNSGKRTGRMFYPDDATFNLISTRNGSMGVGEVGFQIASGFEIHCPGASYRGEEVENYPTITQL